MFTLIALGVLLLVGRVAANKAVTWRQTYKLAQSTGFPVFVSPVHISDAWWMILYPVLLPILEKLPSRLTHGWLTISKLWKFWKMAHRPFAGVGSDTFVLGAAKGNVLYTCDHSVIHDLLTQHPKVQIPVDLVGFYDVWGPTVGSVEGEEWKAHRKVISSGFSQSMNVTVWKEAQRQHLAILEQWSLEQDYPNLQKGYIGAVQKEVLSIYQPASFLLRRIVAPVTLIDSDGVSHQVPTGTLAFPNTSAAYKNPNIWKHTEEVPETRRKAVSDSPAPYFNPDRWLDSNGVVRDGNLSAGEKRQVPDWWAFGQGARACPGKAFAQIEMTSAMATLYRNYSLELVVDEKTLMDCNGDRKLAWDKTRDNGIRMLYDDVEANITISVPTPLPLRVVKRS